MGRFFAYLLILIYFLISIRLSVTVHFCKGKLVKYSFAVKEIPSCCKKKGKKKCCENHHFSLKKQGEEAKFSTLANQLKKVGEVSCSLVPDLYLTMLDQKRSFISLKPSEPPPLLKIPKYLKNKVLII